MRSPARLIAAAAAVMMMTACSSSGKVIDPPENGWTEDELAEQIYIGGKAAGFPISLEDLKEQFEAADAEQTLGEDYHNYYFLKYNGETVGSVFDSDGDGNIDCFSLMGSDKQKSAPVTVNGIGLGSSEKEVSERLDGNITHTTVENEEVFRLTVKTGKIYLTVSGNEKDGVKIIQIEDTGE